MCETIYLSISNYGPILRRLYSLNDNVYLAGVQPATNSASSPTPHGSPSVMPRAAHLGRRSWVGRHRQAWRLAVRLVVNFTPAGVPRQRARTASHSLRGTSCGERCH